MRPSTTLLPWAAGGVTAFTLVAAIMISAEFALAGSPDPVAQTDARAPSCACPGTSDRPQRPKFADLKPQSDGRPLDAGDEMAALTSVQHALSNVADGATYVWHRRNGRLSGLIKPTSSFKSSEGSICRHIVVLLTSGIRTSKAEGVACRQSNGVWSLDG